MSCHPSILRIFTWPLRSKPKSSNRTASWLGRLAWVFVRRRNSPLIRSRAFVVRSAFHCGFGKLRKVKRSIARFLEALDDRWAAQAPLLREADARLVDERTALRIDHPAVILR